MGAGGVVRRAAASVVDRACVGVRSFRRALAWFASWPSVSCDPAGDDGRILGGCRDGEGDGHGEHSYPPRLRAPSVLAMDEEDRGRWKSEAR